MTLRVHLVSVEDRFARFYRLHDVQAHTRKRELPRHVIIAELLARGFNQKEAAALAGCSRENISQLKRNPWFQERVVMAIERNIDQELKEFLDKEVLNSLEVVRRIRDDPSVRAADRLAAAQAILDRRFGRPSQPIVSIEKPVERMSAEELEKEVARILESTGQGNS